VILVGNQRGGGQRLATHLMSPENEQVTLHELRGFASDNLHGAFSEAYAVSRGTRCKQYLFSLSLNPPPHENVPVGVFESAIARIEEKLGLAGQPRAIVFHEKEGPGGFRRHAHAVWSRIDPEKMKAVQLSFSERKLMEVSRELYIENGWKMPRGLMASQERDPRNYTLAEWQQAKRAERNAGEIKAALQDCWAVSDSRAAFENALKERGFTLARGDRRGFLAVDHNGKEFAIAKWAGVKTKAVRERLGPETALPSLGEARQQIARDMAPVMDRLAREQQEQAQKQEAESRARTGQMAQRHSEARRHLEETIAQRQQAEILERQARFNTGARGLWDRITGRHGQIEKQNELEALEAWRRDREEKDNL